MSCPEAQWLMFSATTFSILLKAIHKHYRCIMYKKCQYALQTKNPTEWCHQSPKAQCLMFRSTTFSIILKAMHKKTFHLYIGGKNRLECRIQRIKQYNKQKEYSRKICFTESWKYYKKRKYHKNLKTQFEVNCNWGQVASGAGGGVRPGCQEGSARKLDVQSVWIKTLCKKCIRIVTRRAQLTVTERENMFQQNLRNTNFIWTVISWCDCRVPRMSHKKAWCPPTSSIRLN